jgi:hypothetical protein
MQELDENVIKKVLTKMDSTEEPIIKNKLDKKKNKNILRNRKYNVTFSTLGKYNNTKRTILVECLSASDAADLVWGRFGGAKAIDIENVEEVIEENTEEGSNNG